MAYVKDFLKIVKSVRENFNTIPQIIKCTEQCKVIKRLAKTLMYCSRLHAWWSTQSWLATLFSSEGRTSGDWDCVAAIERLPALHYSVYFIFLSFGIMGFVVEL